MYGAYSLARGAQQFQEKHGGDNLYLVDDLVTSGSSLREGLRALKEVGFKPRGVLVAGVST
jgi:orotate phosphoribosyltransferase